MAGKIVQMPFAGVDVWVETVQLPGSEKTSTLGDTGARVLDAFDGAREVIVGAAASTLSAINGMTVRPDKVEVEFGIGFSVKGNVIVVGASADATLKVKLAYEAHPPQP